MKHLHWVLIAFAAAVLAGCSGSTKKTDQSEALQPIVNAEVGEALLQIVNADHLSLAVYNHDSLSTYQSRGVQDLLLLVSEEPDRLQGAIVADKMVGKAAAALMISAGVAEIYTNLICTPAKELLHDAGVAVHAAEEVPQILNRDRSGQCPIDSRLNDAMSVEECVEILRAM